MNEEIRLQKFISMAGIASRRRAEQMILQGQIKVNGTVVTQMGIKINPDRDVVETQGKRILEEKKKYYIMLNKPTGYITSASDDVGRQTVMDLLTDVPTRVYPVGRLDYQTQGMLLLTNDGEFAQSVTHPSGMLGKTYIAQIKGSVAPEKIKILRTGVDIGGYKTAPAQAELLGGDERTSKVKITIYEGKNLQVRRMFDALGYEVTSLMRIAIGRVELGHLAMGRWRHMNKAEVEAIRKAAGLVV